MEQSGHISTTQGFNTSELKEEEAGRFELNSEKAFSNFSFGLGILILIINSFTLVCLIRHKKNVGGTGFWQQLIFLCLTDIFSGIALSVFATGQFFLHIYPSIYYSFCVTGIVLFPLSVTLSAGNCFLISLMRYIFLIKIRQPVIVFPTLLMISCNIFISTLTIVSSVIIVTIQFGFHPEEFCNMINTNEQNEYKSKYLIGTVILLVIFLLCTNILAVLSILKVKHASGIIPAANAASVISNSDIQSTNNLNRSATKTFILIVLVLNLTTIPPLSYFEMSVFSKVTVSAETTEVLNRILSVNSVFNPFVYVLRMGSFRKAVWKDIKAVMVCCRNYGAR